MVVVRTMLLTLLRGRLYIGMVTAGVMLVVVAILLQELSVGEGQRAFVAIGLAAHALVTDVTAVAAAFTLAQAYLIGRGAIPLMARPVSRSWFVVAAVVALSVATMVNGALLGAMLAVVAGVYEASTGHVALAAAVGTGEALLLGALALALRLRFAAVFSVTTVSALFVLGRLAEMLEQMIGRGTFGSAQSVLRAFHALLPKLELFDWTSVALNGAIGNQNVLTPVIYLALYGSALTALAVIIHQRADFARDSA